MIKVNQVLVGDAATELANLDAGSVDCVVTSPPYFALRNYGEPGQIGLEPHVDEWVAGLLTVFDELARVLKPTGSVWLNVGDSFSRRLSYGAPPKALLLGPERLLLALTNRGWICRNKVVWAKVNPTPASVRDRLNTVWEPVYLLVRSRHYFFDLDAVRVPHRSRRSPSRATIPTKPPEWAGPLAGTQSGLARLHAQGLAGHPLGKNPGDVWQLPTSKLRSAHHAMFPESLVERPILTTCPERVCVVCGAPWVRHVANRDVAGRAQRREVQAACFCEAAWRPGLVLDPFMGAGTTAVVAERLGRDWLGIELNAEFAALTESRLAACRSPNERAA